eukprot:2801728-Rhodomonas_salina.3
MTTTCYAMALTEIDALLPGLRVCAEGVLDVLLSGLDGSAPNLITTELQTQMRFVPVLWLSVIDFAVQHDALVSSVCGVQY